MRAAFYRTKGKAPEVLQIAEVPTPAPAHGEVRVRLVLSGVNPSDVKARAGVSGAAMSFPLIIPHSDGAGVVDAVGAGVATDWIGRRVWVYNGQWERPQGTAAEFIALPLAQAVALPDSVSFEHGASIGIPLMTAYHAIASCGQLHNRTVLIPGAAGAVGQYAVQLARRNGARVIAAVSNEAKARHAQAVGADAVVNYRSENLVAQVRALTGGKGADFLIDVDAGVHAPLYGDLLAFGGKAVVYGSGHATIGMPFRPLIMNFVSVYFFIVYRLPAPLLEQTTIGITQLLRQNALKHSDTKIFPLEQLAAAHELVERGAEAKVLIRV